MAYCYCSWPLQIDLETGPGQVHLELDLKSLFHCCLISRRFGHLIINKCLRSASNNADHVQTKVGNNYGHLITLGDCDGPSDRAKPSLDQFHQAGISSLLLDLTEDCTPPSNWVKASSPFCEQQWKTVAINAVDHARHLLWTVRWPWCTATAPGPHAGLHTGVPRPCMRIGHAGMGWAWPSPGLGFVTWVSF